MRSKGGRAELVLLDHGLYRTISDELRLEYAGLWRALVFGDEAGIRRHSAAMNAADSYRFFAGLLTMRPWDEITRCVHPGGTLRPGKTPKSAADSYRFFAGLLTMRPWDEITRCARPGGTLRPGKNPKSAANSYRFFACLLMMRPLDEITRCAPPGKTLHQTLDPKRLECIGLWRALRVRRRGGHPAPLRGHERRRLLPLLCGPAHNAPLGRDHPVRAPCNIPTPNPTP